ncbi:hypothetical protein BDR26DRAFT_858864 [Obelidium mucronatum]|nr:hypothetical protein BDR26DRAFT_858864 [Obelidium mucronatum]
MIVKKISEQWASDSLVDSTKPEGKSSLLVILKPIALLKCVTLQIQSKSPEYGFSPSALIPSNISNLPHESILLEYEIPFAQRFEPFHFRGLLIAQLVVSGYKLRHGDAIVSLSTRSRVAMWTLEVGWLIHIWKMENKVDQMLMTLEKMHRIVLQFDETDMDMVSSAKLQLGLLFWKDNETMNVWNKMFNDWKVEMMLELKMLGINDDSMLLDYCSWDVEHVVQWGNDLCNRKPSFHEDGDGIYVDLGENAGKKKLWFSSTVSSKEAPTQIMINAINLSADDLQYDKVVHVYPSFKEHEHGILMTELCGGQIKNYVQIPFGNVFDLDTEKRKKQFAKPSRWIIEAARILENVSGKATPDNQDPTLYKPRQICSTAIAIQLLQCKRTKDVKFEWNRIEESTRDAGLYVQYAYARICGIQRNAGSIVSGLVPVEPENVELMDLLGQSVHAIQIASALANVAMGIRAFTEIPHDATVLIPHIISLARSVSGNHNALFVKDRYDVQTSAARLQLWRSTGEVLQNAIGLLTGGISCVAFM